VQTARNLVAAVPKLAASVQGGHHHLQRRFFLLGVHIHRDAAAVVFHGDAAVGVNGHSNAVADARQGFVNRVIHHLVHQVVQGFLVGAAHIHAGAAADGFEAFENLNIFGAVRGNIGVIGCHYSGLQSKLQRGAFNRRTRGLARLHDLHAAAKINKGCGHQGRVDKGMA